MITDDQKRQALISLTKEAIDQLEDDYERVRTDHGRTIVHSEIDELKRKLIALEHENVSDLKPWGVYEFKWGTAIKHEKGKWSKLFVKGQEINVENMSVILHDNGIEFS